MSGGVDSSVAAARLLDEGHDVVGVTLHLWDYPEPEGPGGHGRCCAPEDQYDARRTADALGFPHFTFDRRELFAREVVEPFVDAYLTGLTPSPCTACNRGVKLRELFALADRLGASHVATGHYARVAREGGHHHLLAGVDGRKDQSYFLYATPEEQLARLLFPLGESTKEDVRREALARQLPGASKGESQELCFVGGGGGAYASFVEARGAARVRPGPILGQGGEVVGHHGGIHRFTIGQRKGLGVGRANDGAPAFVTHLDAESGAVTLGGEAQLLTQHVAVEDLHLSPDVALPFRGRVRVRYRHEGAQATVTAGATKGTAVLTFDEPVRAVARGQVAVFYDGPRVLGGGVLTGALVSSSA